MKFTPDKCPECGEDALGIVEVVPGLAGLQLDPETGEYEYSGGTDMWWSDQRPLDFPDDTVRLHCQDHHEWYAQEEGAAPPGPPSRLVLFVEGGLVQDTIIADRPCKVLVVDYDIPKVGGPGLLTLVAPDGATLGEAAKLEYDAAVDPKGVAHYFGEASEETKLCECGRNVEDCATWEDPEAQHGDR